MNLENVLRTLHPEIDVSALLNEAAYNPGGMISGDGLPVGMVRQLDEDSELMDSYERDGAAMADYDYLEWHEDVSSGDAMDTMQDGTACFGSSVERGECGYLGKSAGASILKVIHKLLDIHRDGINAPLSTSADDSSQEHVMKTINRAEEQLVTESVRGSLVDSYFRTYNTFYPVLHERTFRDQYKNFDKIPETSHFHTLLRMVVAIGSLCGSKQASSNEYCFYLSARSRLSADMLESGTVEQIQILLLMSNYLQKRDKPNTGYNLLGLAARMAIGMGLHKELVKDQDIGSGKNTVRMECRRRLWWVLYLFDSGISITFGRPPIMADRVVDVKVPLNIDDTDLKPSDPVPLPSPRATPYTALIAFAKISMISSRMFERFFLRHRPISSPLEMAEYMHLVECFDKQLSQWRNELPHDFYARDCPEWFKEPRAASLWREQNIRTLMYKGMLEAIISGKLTMAPPQDYIHRCLGVALSTVDSIGEYIENNSDDLWWGITWYATYFLFQADLYLILVMIISYDRETAETRTATHKTIKECQEAINRSHKYFSKLQTSNPVSRKCIATLEQIECFLKRYKARKRGEETPEGINQQRPPSSIPTPKTGDSSRSPTPNSSWVQQQQEQLESNEALNACTPSSLFNTSDDIVDITTNGQFDHTFFDSFMNDNIFSATNFYAP